jgi:cob(I)alamin adenosyltransferase
LIIDSLQNSEVSNSLYEIQDRLFTVGSVLASDPATSKMKIPDLHESDIEFLEKEMDKMDLTLPELKNFILPGGNISASYCHVARCVCRRAERIVVLLISESEVPEIIVRYLNRLSDYLFMLSRKIVHDAGAKEIAWRPRM